METVYIGSGMLFFLFVGILLVLRAKEDRATRPRDSASDPMFRRPSDSARR